MRLVQPDFISDARPATLLVAMPHKKKLTTTNLSVSVQLIERRIFLIRGQKVMIDFDLAELYGVSTRQLNQQVTRNKKRFPEDFMFRLTKEETEILRSQFVISRSDLRLQFATSNIGLANHATNSRFLQFGSILQRCA
jgi:hypothetical protein